MRRQEYELDWPHDAFRCEQLPDEDDAEAPCLDVDRGNFIIPDSLNNQCPQYQNEPDPEYFGEEYDYTYDDYNDTDAEYDYEYNDSHSTEMSRTTSQEDTITIEDTRGSSYDTEMLRKTSAPNEIPVELIPISTEPEYENDVYFETEPPPVVLHTTTGATTLVYSENSSGDFTDEVTDSSEGHTTPSTASEASSTTTTTTTTATPPVQTTTTIPLPSLVVHFASRAPSTNWSRTTTPASTFRQMSEGLSNRQDT